MSVLLYTQRINPFAQKVATALILKGVRFETVIAEDPAEVARWSPRTHQLPVLEIDGERRADSNEILHWLDERFPDPPLFSSDSQVAAQQRHLAEWADASFVFYWNAWRQARVARPEDATPDGETGLIGSLRGRLRGGTPAPSPAQLREDEVLRELDHRLDDLVGMLGSRPYFHAEVPSVADLTVFGMLRSISDGMPGGARMVSQRPALAAYVERFEARLGEFGDASRLPLG